MVSGSRGPIRDASRPARDENSSISTVNGANATPATTGVNPATVCSCTCRKNVIPLSAP